MKTRGAAKNYAVMASKGLEAAAAAPVAGVKRRSTNPWFDKTLEEWEGDAMLEMVDSVLLSKYRKGVRTADAYDIWSELSYELSTWYMESPHTTKEAHIAAMRERALKDCDLSAGPATELEMDWINQCKMDSAREWDRVMRDLKRKPLLLTDASSDSKDEDGILQLVAAAPAAAFPEDGPLGLPSLEEAKAKFVQSAQAALAVAAKSSVYSNYINAVMDFAHKVREYKDLEVALAASDGSNFMLPPPGPPLTRLTACNLLTLYKHQLGFTEENLVLMRKVLLDEDVKAELAADTKAVKAGQPIDSLRSLSLVLDHDPLPEPGSAAEREFIKEIDAALVQLPCAPEAVAAVAAEAEDDVRMQDLVAAVPAAPSPVPATPIRPRIRTRGNRRIFPGMMPGYKPQPLLLAPAPASASPQVPSPPQVPPRRTHPAMLALFSAHPVRSRDDSAMEDEDEDEDNESGPRGKLCIGLPLLTSLNRVRLCRVLGRRAL